MKKTFTFIFASLCALGVSALTVSQPQKIEAGRIVHNPVLSADGKMLLFSADDHSTLNILRNLTGAVTPEVVQSIDNSIGVGFNPVFSADGTSVIYQRASIVDGIMNRDVYSYDLSNGRIRKIATMGRENFNLQAMSGCQNYVSADYDRITIAQNGEITELRPIADAHSYLWASLSPDGQKILFVEPFQGVFVCDLDGTNPVNIAKKGAFPAWAGENLITYTLSHDDGYVILDSTLKIYDLSTGITLDLTPSLVLVGESTSAADGTVVYTTLEGELYKFQVK